MGGDVHSFMLSIQHFLFWPCRRQPSQVTRRMVLERLSWHATCPNHARFRLLTVASRGSCGPTRKLNLLRTQSLVLCSKLEMPLACIQDPVCLRDISRFNPDLRQRYQHQWHLSSRHRFCSHGGDINIKNTCFHVVHFIAMAVILTRIPVCLQGIDFTAMALIPISKTFACLQGINFTAMALIPKSRTSISQPWWLYQHQGHSPVFKASMSQPWWWY